MKLQKQIVVYSFLLMLFVAGGILRAKDHPLIKPYPGSTGGIREEFQFDEATIPLGPAKGGKLTKSQPLEGKITKLQYGHPQGRSVLELYRNYEAAVKQGGFEILFTCGPDTCGPYQNVKSVSFPGWGGGAWPNDEKSRHLTARLSRPEGDVWVALEVRPGSTHILVVEVKPMETGMVTVNAAALAGDITRTGHVAVYGILFDTGKADIKPESDPVLADIAKLLKENATLKLHVIGHTDNVGALPMNMDLSKRRAAAVVQALSAKHGIAAGRLNADGVGPLAPVASNDTEEGRAKNRRVELVKQ